MSELHGAAGCPDCQGLSHDPACPDEVSRRRFLTTAVGAGLGAACAPQILRAAEAALPGKDAAAKSSETLVAQLYGSLTEPQKKVVCFPFDAPLRSEVDNNWFIVKQKIGKLFTGEQQALIKEIFLSIHSDQYRNDVLKQVEHDNSDIGGLAGCSVALFGEPGGQGAGGKSKFEFVLTGRHVTRRCDGNSVAGAAFGGPIFYGHAAESFNEKPDHPGNVYWFQAKRANEVFQALDGRQRTLALCTGARGERGKETVELPQKKDDLHGIPMTELTKDQKGLVRKVLADLLAPFRKADADEALALIEKGSFDALHLAFYKNLDIGDDGVWDVWQIESPNMIWYFRGKPHVHTWVHIREPAGA